jgi:uncharacterized protein with LGFP repeats
MPTLNDAQAAAFKLANKDAEFNPDSAIAKRWLQLKRDGMLIGVPIGQEMPLDNGQVAQAFTSGAVLVWRGGDQVDLV